MRTAKFSELVEITFILGEIRPLHNLLWFSFEFNSSLTYFQDYLNILLQFLGNENSSQFKQLTL